MELNVELVKSFSDFHQVSPLAPGDTHNIFKLSPGLCHKERASVLVNGRELSSEQYKFILPSSEFKVRYGLDSVSALMLLDNNIRGTIEIRVCPIGGIYQELDMSGVPSIGKLTTFYGNFLEDFGQVSGLESFGRIFSEIPSRATDIDGILVGRTSYPGSTDSTNIDELQSRVELLEISVYHDDSNIPTIDTPTKALFIDDRSVPRVQLTSQAPDVTWYLEPQLTEIMVSINVMTGELMWVDAIPEPGIYKIAVYIMSNGVRSDIVNIPLNVS